jgi:fatty-acyl-CoA synthase
VGRSKDVIIRGGENIFPKEVEDCLRQHTDFEDVEVIGVPDDKYGEEVCAVIKIVPSQKSENSDLTAQEVAEYCRGRIAK